MPQKYILYLIADPEFCTPYSIDQVVNAALESGVDVVQLRSKKASRREILQCARYIQPLCTGYEVPFLINDHVDVALACQANGVHLGQNDLPPQDARRLLGYNAIIGFSIENIEQVEGVYQLDPVIDYLGVGPIFNTRTKSHEHSPLGLDGLREIRRRTSQTIIAIGGIDQKNASSTLKAGADGIALLSAICSSEDPKGVLNALKRIR